VAEPRWIEVSLTVDGELAEAVAEVITRYTTQGVVIEQAVQYNTLEDMGTPYGPMRVYGYIVIDSGLEQTKHNLEEALWHLGQIQPLPQVTYRTIEDQDWMAAWKEHYHPIPIGEKLMILPAWLESTDPQRRSIKIDPSMAFGTGTHPTTQLCLALLERYVEPGKRVIDLGCGSGILAIAALKLGAKTALAVDIDPAAVRSTTENALTNEVEDGIETGVGSLEDILAGKFSIKSAPLVLVNILAPIIQRLFNEGLERLIKPGGLIILSGILVEQSAMVEMEAELCGLEIVDKLTQGDWVALAYRR
jgi:ribosomal protein L11 methyltransferase